MGNTRSSKWWSPDVPPPEPEFVPKYDPMIGFPNGRKERGINSLLRLIKDNFMFYFCCFTL